MHQVTRGRLVTMVVTAGLVLSACGGSSATTAPSAAAPSAAAPSVAAPSVAAPSAAAPSAAPDGTLPAPEQTSVKIGLSVTSEPSQYAEELAFQVGIYKKYGITAEVIGFEGDGKATQALIAGQVDFITVGSSSVINSRLTDTPFKIMSMNSVLINDGLFCTKNIKTAADVKGKTVAVSTFGGTSHGSVLLSLKSLGLTSADVTITEIGGQSSRIAALVGGSIGCAPVDVSLAADMKAQGLNQLTDLVKSGLAWGRSGLAASDDYLAKNPNTALVVVASALEAQNMFWTDPATVAQNFADYAQIKLDVATAAVKAFPNTGDRTMMWTTDAFTMPQQTLAAVQPDIAGVDLSTVADPSFLKKLADIGFYAKIGNPLP